MGTRRNNLLRVGMCLIESYGCSVSNCSGCGTSFEMFSLWQLILDFKKKFFPSQVVICFLRVIESKITIADI